MKVYAVKRYFHEGKWSFYPDELLSEEALAERGLKEGRIVARVTLGDLEDTELEVIQASDPPPSLAMLSHNNVPEEGTDQAPTPKPGKAPKES